jgi:uncharacterized membrane protein YbaN (DUF454 family)
VLARIQQAVILLSAACLAPTTFRHYLINDKTFGNKVTEYKARVLIFSTALFEIFLILRKIQPDIVINVKTSSCKVQVRLVRLY